MRSRGIYWVAKVLEGAGMIVVLAGLLMSIQLGFEDQGLESMRYEGTGLLVGLAMFAVGWMLERSIGSR